MMTWWLRPRRTWVRAQARWFVSGDRAVVLDVETTDFDGAICQIAIIDTAGRVLVDSLVAPGVPCTPAASAVHGLVDEDLVGAPTWEQLWPTVTGVIGSRKVLAYNAPFDRGRLVADCRRAGVDVGALGSTGRWWCVMRARSTAEGRPWRRLGGNHDALGDARETLRLMHAMGAKAPVCGAQAITVYNDNRKR